jgi:hypothetical protein
VVEDAGLLDAAVTEALRYARGPLAEEGDFSRPVTSPGGSVLD